MSNPATANATAAPSTPDTNSPPKVPLFKRMTSAWSNADVRLQEKIPTTTALASGFAVALAAPPLGRAVKSGYNALAGALSRGAHDKVQAEVGGEAAKALVGGFVKGLAKRYK